MEKIKSRFAEQGQKICNHKIAVYIRKRKELLICLIFTVFALTQGLLYAFKMPCGQVPDEMTHYQMMEEEFGTSGYINELIANVYNVSGLNKLPFHPEEKVNQEAVEDVSQARFSQRLTLGSFHPRITIVKHLPGGVGFYLGVAFQLPIIWCTYLAEIFSVLFFTGIGYLTIRTSPIKKDIFAFCLLMPQTLQMCSSINYDAVLIPCSFLLFAYILKLYYSDTPVRWKNILIILLLTAVVTITKPPYALIALTILIIPAKQFDLKIGKKIDMIGIIHQYRYIAVLLVILMAAGGLYLFRENVFVKTIISDILCFPQFLSLMGRTLRESGYYYITGMIGIFGWLDSTVSPTFMLIFLMMLTYLNTSKTENVDRTMTTGRRVWLTVVFASAILLSYIALQEYSYDYLGWDRSVGISTFNTYISKLSSILGYQGRYWIPCLPVILVAVTGNLQRKDRKLYWAAQIAFYVFNFITVITILDGRYWIR